MKTDNELLLLIQFGRRVRELRQAQSLSQEELASRANVHRTYIGMVERGEKNITLVTMIRMAAALGTSLSQLVEGLE